jgi:hypothetical protein
LDGVEGNLQTMASGAYSLKVTIHAVIAAEPSPVAQRFATFLRSPEAAAIIRESGGSLVPAPGTTSATEMPVRWTLRGSYGVAEPAAGGLN